MTTGRRLVLPLLGLTLVTIVGVVGGLAFSGGAGSEDASSAAPVSSPGRVAAPAPAPSSPPATTDAPIPAPASESPQELSTEVTVEPDPNFEAALRSAGISTRGLKTDFARHSVAFEEFLGGGPPKDGIPAIDNPTFVTVAEAEEWLEDREPVAGSRNQRRCSRIPHTDTYVARNSQ